MNITEALRATFISPNESDRNGESANVVDGLFAIARSIENLTKAIEGKSEEEGIKITFDPPPPPKVNGLAT